MKLTDALVTLILKKGVLYEAKNFEADIDVPDSNIKVHVTIDNMTLKVEKDGA